jgi:metal-responsive CopG/Arc/MetJ family transcriptional regulator
VTVNLPARVWDELGRIANESQISRTEALRQAINTEVVLRKVRSEGADVCIRRPDGTLERMVFTY